MYKKMRAELSALQAELVVVQRTEQILRTRHKNLDEFIAEEERRKSFEASRDAQRENLEAIEKSTQADQTKGMTLDQISNIVDSIGREFKNKQSQLQPLISQLKSLRQDYMNLEAEHADARSTYDRVAVGLELEKQNLEKECDALQVCNYRTVDVREYNIVRTNAYGRSLDFILPPVF